MYSKKYRLAKVEEFNRNNPMYDEMLGCVCYPAYINVGERGWFLCEVCPLTGATHRVHTSTVNDVQYDGGTIVVTTRNTRLTFTSVNTDTGD